MQSLFVMVVGLALIAAFWSGGPAPAFADDLPTGQSWCDPARPFLPGTGLGPVRIGMPLDAVQHWYGRPRSVENRRLQGHQWTHMRFTNIDVMGRDNAVIALNVVQTWPVPLAPNCARQIAQPFNLPIGYLQQTYGPPIQSTILNGLQYWLYDKLGLLLTIPVGGAYVQGLTVYQPDQFCYWAPVFVSFGGFSVMAGNALRCAASAGDRER
jgi:hypothetical protein